MRRKIADLLPPRVADWLVEVIYGRPNPSHDFPIPHLHCHPLAKTISSCYELASQWHDIVNKVKHFLGKLYLYSIIITGEHRSSLFIIQLLKLFQFILYICNITYNIDIYYIWYWYIILIEWRVNIFWSKIEKLLAIDFEKFMFKYYIWIFYTYIELPFL